MIGHSRVGSSCIYSEGEFLCIVSKHNERGLREDANNSVSERVKVRNNKEENQKQIYFLF